MPAHDLPAHHEEPNALGLLRVRLVPDPTCGGSRWRLGWCQESAVVKSSEACRNPSEALSRTSFAQAVGRRQPGSPWDTGYLMSRLLVAGLVAMLVLTGCVPSSQVTDAPVRSGAVPSAPSSVEPPPNREAPSESAGDASTSAEPAASEPGSSDVGAETAVDDLFSEAETQPASDPEWGQLHDVVSVSDGDTITVDVDGVRERVRVIGIDAPEMAGSGTAAECYAQPATSRMQSLLQGSRVHLLPDPTQADRDQYDRLLRHVVLDGGGHVGLILLEEGYAVERQYADPYQWQPERWPLRAGLRRQATLAGSCVASAATKTAGTSAATAPGPPARGRRERRRNRAEDLLDHTRGGGVVRLRVTIRPFYSAPSSPASVSTSPLITNSITSWTRLAACERKGIASWLISLS